MGRREGQISQFMSQGLAFVFTVSSNPAITFDLSLGALVPASGAGGRFELLPPFLTLSQYLCIPLHVIEAKGLI